ncbi:endo-1,4-beta-xylanase [Phycicoccus sp. Soil803]|uniref:endo-1,4-beta-xylanase n=1 Tax=Phycicoccus sp. Soil803 TaxID=1736415 RepID=UPI000B171CF0|nr:endo-1,4-beta-xylanase [Phycicoccus sp. Soil803]
MKIGRTKAVLAAMMGLTLSTFATQPASGSTVTDPITSDPVVTVGSDSDIGSLREEAAKIGILFGSGAIKASDSIDDGRPPNYLTDPDFARVLAEQFDSVHSENEMKYRFVEPQQGVFDFTGPDRLVKFAQEQGMQVKGHALITTCCDPQYLVDKVNDPAAFRALMTKHITTIMKRYKGKMDRWDVVVEPLSTMGGQGLQHTDFYNALGPGYIAEAFRIAHRADPTAKLYVNENLVESYPEKRKEFYDLVDGLVADEVPIDGVALQMHETLQGPPAGVIIEMADHFHAKGLAVSISELDVHTLDPVTQAQIYGDVVTEALNAGIRDISTWGFTDKHLYTWLPGAKPCLFDENYNPKPAYFAVRDALRAYGRKVQASP